MKSQTDAAFVLAVCKHGQRRERVGENYIPLRGLYQYHQDTLGSGN